MRPDQHKKKQSAAYKKKHGIKDGDIKSKRDEKKKAEPGKPVTSQEKDKSKDKRVESGRQYVKLPEFSSSDEERSFTVKESGGVVQPGKRFQKRQVVSNWSRYEVDHTQAEEDKTSLRVLNFTQLVNSTGDALSQFRLKDEEDWDEDAGEMLMLDVNDLRQAVHSVPLHERLAIPAHHFSDEIIHSFEETARKQAALYKEQTSLCRSAETQPKPDLVVSGIVRPGIPSPSSFTTETLTIGNITDVLDEILNDSGGIITHRDITDSANNTSNPDQSKVQSKVQINSTTQEDEDLDFLLSVDKPIMHKEENKELALPKNSLQESENAHHHKKNEQTDFKPNVTENLEDWLDSVLDN